mmetsp:Transcript_1279/g.2831  ORF Transcript_1279/g.2831 Transcript_1279/m.2831 type:complete len:294 (+) Transcript_1279:2943-3824(+)
MPYLTIHASGWFAASKSMSLISRIVPAAGGSGRGRYTGCPVSSSIIGIPVSGSSFIGGNISSSAVRCPSPITTALLAKPRSPNRLHSTCAYCFENSWRRNMKLATIAVGGSLMFASKFFTTRFRMASSGSTPFQKCTSVTGRPSMRIIESPAWIWNFHAFVLSDSSGSHFSTRKTFTTGYRLQSSWKPKTCSSLSRASTSGSRKISMSTSDAATCHPATPISFGFRESASWVTISGGSADLFLFAPRFIPAAPPRFSPSRNPPTASPSGLVPSSRSLPSGKNSMRFHSTVLLS